MKLERSKCLLKPNTRVILAPDDELYPPSHGVTVLAFRKSQAVPSAKIKDSLCEILKEYREFAGCFVFDEASGCLAIELNDRGVPFEEASSDMSLETILHSRDFTDLVPEIGPNTQNLLLVQYTSLSCGGFALGIGGHHQAIDACSFWRFADAWAKVARGVTLDRTLVHNRDPLMPREPLHFDQQKLDTYMMKSQAAATTTTCEVKVARIHVSREGVEKLKTRCVASSNGLATNYSTFVCLAACLWKQVVVHCGINNVGDVHKATTSIAILVNSRRVLNVPEEYFGNALALVTPSCTVQELMEHPLGYAAGLVHAAIKGVSGEKIREEIDLCEFLKRKHVPMFFSPAVDLSLNSWVGFPLYKCDFGGGDPALASISHELHDRSVFIQPAPPCQGEGLEVFICLEEHVLNAVVNAFKEELLSDC